MSLKSALKLLFLHICFHAVVAKLRTPKDKTQQRSLRTVSPALDVTIADISVKFNNAKGYDANGCLDPKKATVSKYYAQVQYEIRNNGDAGFIAPPGTVDYAACGTPAILNFLSLKIEGGIDGSGNPYPIELSRFATCVIDDSNTADAGSCVSGGASTIFTQKPSQSYGINQGGSYGVTKKVYAKFPLTTEQFNSLSKSLPSTLTFTLSVNKNISPNGAAGVVTAVDGSKLKDGVWQTTGQGTSVLLFIRPPTAATTTAPTIVPSDEPTTSPTAAPIALPTTAPTAIQSASPSTTPSTAPITAAAASSIICDKIIEPNPGTTTVSGYANDQTLAGVCLTTDVQSISDQAFGYYKNAVSTISSINIPSSVKTIGRNAFDNSKLKNVTFNGDISLGPFSFYGMNYRLASPKISLVFPGAVDIGTQAFYYSRVVSMSFGGIVSSIGETAFGANPIKSVIFPSGLSFVGNNAFRECYSLSSVTFRGAVATIGDTAFRENALKSVTFLGPVASFGVNVFQLNPAFTVYYPGSWAIPRDKFPSGTIFVSTA